MKHIDGIRDIAAPYDGFIIDLWGVMHDGMALYPRARDALAFLHEQRKPVVFLSNAPRRADKAQVILERLGIAREQYDTVVTSGEVAFTLLQQGKLNDALQGGRHYYYLGPGKDEDVLDGLPVCHAVSDPAAADFILNAGFEQDFQPEAEIEPTLQRLLAHRLPLLCINPDIEVVKQDGTRMYCAGRVAARYAALGGTVRYIGKPHPEVYAACLAALGAPARVLCIGDNLHTDIKGAAAQGFDSLLITGGILKTEQGGCPDAATLAHLCDQAAARPDYVAELFAA